MKTTLNIDDTLYRRAKVKAAEEGMTVSELIEEGLYIALEPGSQKRGIKRIPLPLIEGGRPASRGKEMTPERTSEILLDQEVKWSRKS